MNTSQPQPTSPYPDNRNNDQLWVGGIFYVNPYDPRLLVEKRSGLGWTFNFAYPIGWWLTGGLFVFLGFVQLIFFVIFYNPFNLALLCLFLALGLPLLVAGFLSFRASRRSKETSMPSPRR